MALVQAQSLQPRIDAPRGALNSFPALLNFKFPPTSRSTLTLSLVSSSSNIPSDGQAAPPPAPSQPSSTAGGSASDATNRQSPPASRPAETSGDSTTTTERTGRRNPDHEDDGRTYHLEVVQHPERAAEYGSAVLSRLPLAPPLVVQLVVRDRDGNEVPVNRELPFLVAHLSLHSRDGLMPIDLIRAAPNADNPEPPPASSQRMLYGTLVSSPHYLNNLQGRPGNFFIFPDVSVRSRGQYQLAVTLIRIARTDGVGVMEAGGSSTVLTTARTRMFDVVSQNEYVAPAATPLTVTFHRQGARMYSFLGS